MNNNINTFVLVPVSLNSSKDIFIYHISNQDRTYYDNHQCCIYRVLLKVEITIKSTNGSVTNPSSVVFIYIQLRFKHIVLGSQIVEGRGLKLNS